jgi:hypothetical protein
LQLWAEIQARFHVPAAPRTLARLEAITAKVRQHEGVNVEPMQLAALVLEKTTEQISDDDVSEVVRRPRRRRAGR